MAGILKTLSKEANSKTRGDELRNVLLITGNPIASKMAGPAIRVVQLGKQISTIANVIVVSTDSCTIEDNQIDLGFADSKRLKQLSKWADVIITQGFVLAENTWLREEANLLISDLYDPMHLEHLEDAISGDFNKSVSQDVLQTIAAINLQVRLSDFFLCASEKQRDYWLGHLGALGRINVSNYLSDSSFRDLIDVVPFGIDADFVSTNTHPIRKSIHGIEQDDFVLIWGGGIYNWFDPETLIRAIGIAVVENPKIKLFFLGVNHPSSTTDIKNASFRAREVSNQLGLTDKFVFFNETWVDYSQRGEYLADADVGVSTHMTQLETHFSFRTRILDYLWVGLPIIATEGDVFAELIESNNLGSVVKVGDVEGLAQAIKSMASDSEKLNVFSQNSKLTGKEFSWENTSRPLLEFITNGKPASDLAEGTPSVPLVYSRKNWVGHKISGLKVAFESQGIVGIWNRMKSRFN